MDDAYYLPPAEGFERLADTYDARLSGDPTLQAESEALAQLLPDPRGKLCGDIGCGTGRCALALARAGAKETIGIDLAPAMLARARRKARDQEVILKLGRGDLLGALPLPDSYLDLAVCALTLSFVGELERAFSELARTLVPGAALVITELHPHGLRTARAESRHAPYLRFMDCDGIERRIARWPHLTSDYLRAADTAGLTLEALTEPTDARTGLPLVLALRLRKR